MSSLRGICKDRILAEIVRAVQPQSGWKALVVDQVSLRIISACCNKLNDIMEDVTVVENIALGRTAQPSVEAIYFISPQAESVDMLVADFKKKSKMYACAHVFFTSKLPETEFKKLSAIAGYIRVLKEVNMEFIPNESQSFHLDIPEGMVGLYGGQEAAKYKDIICSKLLTLLSVLNEYPIIRSSNQPVATSVANTIQQRLDKLAATATGWIPNEERAVLLILDRTVDPITPLLHEFTYQAMIYDLLNIQNDKYSYKCMTNSGVSQTKEATLNDADVFYPLLRHMHIAETTDWLTNNFKEFINTNKALKLTNGSKIDTLKDMSEAVRAMPQYAELLNKYSLHIDLGGSAMDVFNHKGLERIAHLEQDMATGEDENHRAPKHILSRLTAILSESSVSKEDKMRLLILFIISQHGIKDQDRKNLMELAKIPVADQVAIANISALGVTINKATKGKSKKEEKKKGKKRSEDVAYELSRYAPALSSILEDLVHDTLSNAEFPDTPGNPAVTEKLFSDRPKAVRRVSLKGAGRGGKPVLEDKLAAVQQPQGRKVIVFIAGGMTHAEMRAAYEVSKASNKTVIIGSTHIITPQKFLGDLAQLRRL